MKEEVTYTKTYKFQKDSERIDKKYDHLAGYLESISIVLSKNPLTYLMKEKSFISKVEINYERIDNEDPFVAIANVEKQGKNLKERSEIEKILIENGFKPLDKPVVQ